MKFLDRLLGRTETRSLENPALGWIGLDHHRGDYGAVGPAHAQQIAAVGAAVDLLSTAIAALPVSIYRDGPDGSRVDLPAHPAAALLTRPNAFQTWFEWVTFTMSSVLLEGNALSIIETDGRGAAVSLTPIPWSCVRVSLSSAGGGLLYTVTGYQGDMSQTRTFAADSVFHLKDRPGANPYLGESRIRRCSAMLESALAVQEFATATFRNGATPKGLLVLPKNVSPEQVRKYEAWHTANFEGAHNAGRTLIAMDGTSWTSLSSNAERVAGSRTRGWCVQEVARLFGIPAQLLADPTGSTYTNSATATVWLAQNGLRPWIVAFEQAFDRTVIAEPGCTCRCRP